MNNTQNLDNFIQQMQNNFDVEKKLFSPEVFICVAYCDSLFEAGILNRQESERIKNGLQTIKKRAEFDSSYLAKSNSENIYRFIEEKLYNLVGDIALKIQIGRSFHDRNSTAIRLWLRKEVVNISQTLRQIQRFFVDLAEKNIDKNFITYELDRPHPVLFAHWALSNFDVFQRDRERLDEVWRRVNTLTLGSNYGIGTSLEYDREELADKLGFHRISTNSLDAISDQDFMLEFVNSIVLIAIHISQLIESFVEYNKFDLISFGKEIKIEQLILINGKLKKVFSYQTELNNNLITKSLKCTEDFTGNTEAIFGLVKLMNNCLTAFTIITANLKLNLDGINSQISDLLPCFEEIFEYLVERNELVENAKSNAHKIVGYIHLKKEFSEEDLEALQKISSSIQTDFFEEMSVETIINGKNQIGGTSKERVLEALEDSKRTLQYEE